MRKIRTRAGPAVLSDAETFDEWVRRHADSRQEQAAMRGRRRHADGRIAAALLAADRRRQRVRRDQPRQAGAAHGRGPRALSRSRRHLRPDRPALLPPPRRHVLRLRRGMRPALQLSRLALRRKRRVHRAALRGHGASRRQHEGSRIRIKAYPVQRTCRADLGLSRPGAGAAGAELGAVHLEERLHPDRDFAKSRATGCSARRTRSTRCISSGCM